MALVSLAQGALAWAAASLLAALASDKATDPVSLAGVGVVAALVKVALSGWIVRTEVSLSRRLGDELRDQALGGLLAGHPRQGGDDVFRLLTSTREIEQAALVGGLGGARALASLLPLLALLSSQTPPLLLASLALWLPLALLLARVRRALLRDERSALDLASSLEHQTDLLFRHVDLWRVAGSGPRARAWVRHLGRLARLSLASVRARRALLSASNEAFAALALLLAVLASSRNWISLPTPQLASFAGVVLLAYRPLRDWGDARNAWRSGQIALAQIEPWLAPISPPDLARPCWSLEPLEARDFGAPWHAIRWNFRLAPGSLVLVVGPNGSGKSTLLRALLGLEPAEGSLRWGEVELGERGVGPEQRPAAWAPQQAALLSGSLEENLALGGASVPEARAWLGELGERLGDVALGEGGRGLSGGERAWVNLARAWATGLPLLLLDEPTASLDTDAERRLVEAVEGLRGQRTVVVVTHRPELWRPDQVLATGRPG